MKLAGDRDRQVAEPEAAPLSVALPVVEASVDLLAIGFELDYSPSEEPPMAASQSRT
jgi:hypothetical protein